MKIKKLGIEWGAAFEEAQPLRLINENAVATIWQDENGAIIIQTHDISYVEVRDGNLVVIVPA